MAAAPVGWGCRVRWCRTGCRWALTFAAGPGCVAPGAVGVVGVVGVVPDTFLVRQVGYDGGRIRADGGERTEATGPRAAIAP